MPRRLTDGERDVRREQERDARDCEEHDDTGVELVTAPCPGCGVPVTAPIDAEGDDVCCSPDCVRVVLARMQADEDAAWAAYHAERVARMRTVSCVRCRRETTDEPDGLGWCHSGTCEAERMAELYATAPPETCDDDGIPF